MTNPFSIITPAFKQTDWLRLCVLSVADQVVPEACGIVNSLLNIDDSEAGRAEAEAMLKVLDSSVIVRTCICVHICM